MSQKDLLIETVGGIHHATLMAARISDGTFIEQLVDLAEIKPKLRLVLDFSNVEYISSAVIGKCVKIAAACKAANGRFAIVGANREITKVFEITKLADKLNLVADFSAVRASWA